MEPLYFKKLRELKKEKTELEQKLNVKISIKGKLVKAEGSAVDEYEASIILEALQFGFSANKAMQLMSNDIVFRKIPIKRFTRRKDMKEVRGRIIGKQGKTKNTIEEISGCNVLINENENLVGLIGPASQIDEATTAVTNLIKGSKQSNVYRFLERMNANKKSMDTDLGLKIKKKE